MPPQRLFVAVVPPDPAVEDLDAFLDVRREHGDLRWSASDQFHLTLAFLPAVPDRALDRLIENLERAASRRHELRATIAGGGAFPDPAAARVLWAGVEVDDPEELDRLSAGARAAATTAGIEAAGERFRPHVTVARSGRRFEATRWLRILDAYRGPDFAIDEVGLFSSHLGEGPRRRPRHEEIARFRVSSGPEQPHKAN